MFTKIITMCLLSSAFIFSSCDYKKYAEGIKKDTQKKFDMSKNFIYRLSFEGQITKKEFCKECECCKYKLKIELSQLSEKPVLGNIEFSPYYSFENDSLLSITVSKELFEQVKEKDTVFKEKESFNLKVGEQKLFYLNKGKYKWLP